MVASVLLVLTFVKVPAATSYECQNRDTGLPRKHTARGSRTAVIVLDPDDVVLTEIAAGLNLDQLQQYLAGFLQPMHGADRNIDRFVLVHRLDGFIHRDARRTSHHDPVLRAVMVFLQGESSARFHDDAFDLMALTHVDRLIGAPGTMHLEMLFGHLRGDRL